MVGVNSMPKGWDEEYEWCEGERAVIDEEVGIAEADAKVSVDISSCSPLGRSILRRGGERRCRKDQPCYMCVVSTIERWMLR